jgi:multidrug efflux pump
VPAPRPWPPRWPRRWSARWGHCRGQRNHVQSSSLGNTRVTLQFDLNRDINGAARDVQAAINAARTPAAHGMPSNPTYRKVNPADSPIMILSLTSDTLTPGQMYDAASTVLAQQKPGAGGRHRPGQHRWRCLARGTHRAGPQPPGANGISLEDMRVAITGHQCQPPQGHGRTMARSWQITPTTRPAHGSRLRPADRALPKWGGGAPAGPGEVVDSVQDMRNYGVANGKPAILLMLFKQPNANIIESVDKVRALLPHLRASDPGGH